MYCSKCGKEISDDSKFCYNCGLKIDTIKSSANIEKNTLTSQDTDKSTKRQDAKEKNIVTNDNQHGASFLTKRRYTWGLLVLLMFYGYSVSQWMKNPSNNYIPITTIVIILSLPLLIFLYFKSKKIF